MTESKIKSKKKKAAQDRKKNMRAIIILSIMVAFLFGAMFIIPKLKGRSSGNSDKNRSAAIFAEFDRFSDLEV